MTCAGAVAEKLLFPQEGQILMLVITLLPHASQKLKFTLFSSILNRCLYWAISSLPANFYFLVFDVHLKLSMQCRRSHPLVVDGRVLNLAVCLFCHKSVAKNFRFLVDKT